jgi:hypothetical protein
LVVLPALLPNPQRTANEPELIAPPSRVVSETTLPAPRTVVPETVPPVIVLQPYPPYQRQNCWEVWQYVDVDRRGGFKPRVIYGPSGAYYLYNGKPYLWPDVHPLGIKPVLTGSR